jgi:hypothetical protein
MTPPDEMTTSVGAIALRTGPGLFVSVLTWNGIIAFLTAFFLVLQIWHFIWKMRNERMDRAALAARMPQALVDAP